MYKLKNVNGRVNCLLRTGKDFVKNNLSVSAAQHIICLLYTSPSPRD